MPQPMVKEFFDSQTSTLSYIVWDPNTSDAIVIDPVWDYDQAASKLSKESVDKIMDYMNEKKLKLRGILETHAHADHLSGAQVLKSHFPEVPVAIGANITKVQTVFRDVFHLPKDFKTDGSQFDILLHEGETKSFGSLQLKVFFTPGHTPACSSYLIGNALFTGDALFMPDYGTGRCDFPEGSAEELYRSITEKIFKLPDETRVYTGHDYQPNGRALKFESTVGEEKAQNIQLKEGTSREEFVSFRTERDKKLSAPRLLLPSIQINIDAGHLPATEGNGRRYLRIPIK